MTNVSREMNHRGLIVAALGIVLGVLCQASLTDPAVLGHPSATRVPDELKMTGAPLANRPQGSRDVTPDLSQAVEIARLDVRTASK